MVLVDSLDGSFFTSQFCPVGRPGSKNKILLALIDSQALKNGFLTFIFLSGVFSLHQSLRHPGNQLPLTTA